MRRAPFGGESRDPTKVFRSPELFAPRPLRNAQRENPRGTATRKLKLSEHPTSQPNSTPSAENEHNDQLAITQKHTHKKKKKKRETKSGRCAHILRAEAEIPRFRVGDHHPNAGVAEVALAVEKHHRAFGSLENRVLHPPLDVCVAPKPADDEFFMEREEERHGNHGSGGKGKARRKARRKTAVSENTEYRRPYDIPCARHVLCVGMRAHPRSLLLRVATRPSTPHTERRPRGSGRGAARVRSPGSVTASLTSFTTDFYTKLMYIQ